MLVSPLYEGVCARDVATVLAAWMNATPKPLTALLEDLTGTPVRLRVLASGERPLTSREQFRLGAFADPVDAARAYNAAALEAFGEFAWLNPV